MSDEWLIKLLIKQRISEEEADLRTYRIKALARLRQIGKLHGSHDRTAGSSLHAYL